MFNNEVVGLVDADSSLFRHAQERSTAREGLLLAVCVSAIDHLSHRLQQANDVSECGHLSPSLGEGSAQLSEALTEQPFKVVASRGELAIVFLNAIEEVFNLCEGIAFLLLLML